MSISAFQEMDPALRNGAVLCVVTTCEMSSGIPNSAPTSGLGRLGAVGTSFLGLSCLPSWLTFGAW